MNQMYERPDFVQYRAIWKMIRDAIEANVKTKTYLPDMVPSGDSEYDERRNRDYRERAIYYNFTGRTHAGLIGQMFYRDPQVDAPELLKSVITDIDGSGIAIEQQAKETAGVCAACGRYGLLVDYPRIEASVSRADIATGRVKPTVLLYQPEQIINWRTQRVGGKQRLTLVVLYEQYESEDDGFEQVMKDQWRVLRLTEAGYTMAVWRFGEDEKTLSAIEDGVVIRDSTGAPWREIPFIIGGSTNNDPGIDNPPLRPLAELNIGHLRNSADHEEALHMLGQPTPWASGITVEHKKQVMDDKPVLFGSRTFLMLPEGGQAGLITMPDSSALATAMESKEKRAASLGAKLIESQSTQRTATETNRSSMVEDSVLSTIAKNVSQAYMQALKWCQAFLGETGAVNFELSTDYDFNKMTPQERQILVAEWQAGGITDEEYRWNIRRSGVGYLDDKKWQKWKDERDNQEDGPDLDRGGDNQVGQDE